MRKYSFLLTLLTISTVLGVLSSCKKNNLTVDVDPLDVPSRSRFTYTDITNPVARIFYVEATAPDNMFNLPVGITDVSNVDRTVQVTFSSTTAVAGTHYTAPATVVIPAGQAVANLPITGIFANIPAGVAHVLKAKITGGDVPAFGSGRDSVLITLQRYCTPTIAGMSGAYNNTLEYNAAGAVSWGPYITTITGLTLVAGSTTVATGTVSNLYDDSWGTLPITLDWTSKNGHKVIIPLSPINRVPAYSGGFTHARTSTAAGAVHTFSACDRSLTFSFDLVNPTTGALGFSNQKVVMK